MPAPQLVPAPRGASSPGKGRGRRGGPKRVVKPSTPPSLRLERSLWREGAGRLAAMDEVGRGALAGPVSVGVVLLDADCKPGPQGLRDSKLLTHEARVALAPRIRRWAPASAVGHASAAEIDAYGILAALRLAAERAVAALPGRPEWVLLDGNHNYLRRPGQLTLADALEEAPVPDGGWVCDVPVRTVVKGDMTCSSIAAASILAKTERDAIMEELARRHPAFGWEQNRGYATPWHTAAVAEHGPCEQHRRSWRLPGRDEPVDEELLEQLEVVETLAGPEGARALGRGPADAGAAAVDNDRIAGAG
ncbi:ribonuclease HII [Motilibacter aurantiacus]|uniref:ribonuclease HII n=1 Tax=Motilibacter aurantiacus TaxID=2714955 RepID=UPI00140B3315|nr:ribonuclease HII [Motilibacter aurantiacus]NHC44632.1 ribonuclease HII [Motilibacter aurantiacus]